MGGVQLTFWVSCENPQSPEGDWMGGVQLAFWVSCESPEPRGGLDGRLALLVLRGNLERPPRQTESQIMVLSFSSVSLHCGMWL